MCNRFHHCFMHDYDNASFQLTPVLIEIGCFNSLTATPCIDIHPPCMSHKEHDWLLKLWKTNGPKASVPKEDRLRAQS